MYTYNIIYLDNLHFPCPRRSSGRGFLFRRLMQRFKIIIAYDGTDFFGWQIQPNQISITSCLQESFYKIFKHQISILGASRTDTGVHALGQVAQFFSDLPLPEEIIMNAWNAGLPNSIVIRDLKRVSDNFHPCQNVTQKIYYYHLFLKRPLPFVARYGWLYKFIDQVDLEKFNKGLQLYIGEHDFASFCKVEPEKATVRTIDSITVQKLSHWSMLRVTIKGKSFLRHQIRRMVGYALDVARRENLPVHYLQEVLESKNPQQTLLKADGSGLCLRKVFYEPKFSQ